MFADTHTHNSRLSRHAAVLSCVSASAPAASVEGEPSVFSEWRGNTSGPFQESLGLIVHRCRHTRCILPAASCRRVFFWIKPKTKHYVHKGCVCAACRGQERNRLVKATWDGCTHLTNEGRNTHRVQQGAASAFIQQGFLDIGSLICALFTRTHWKWSTRLTSSRN